MKRKLGLQLYTLREAIEKEGMVSILSQVKAMGYDKVEPAGFGGLGAADFAAACKDNGLEIVSAHAVPLELDKVNETLDTISALGLKSYCVGYGPDSFKDMDSIKASAEKTCQIIDAFAGTGITVFQHNHFWEFEMLDGRLKYDWYLDICPAVKMQLDAYWSANFGANNPVEMTRKYADRIVLLHMKDGVFTGTPEEKNVDLRPLGNGQLDIPGIVAEVPASVGEIIVELDSSNIEIKESVRISAEYLKKIGLC